MAIETNLTAIDYVGNGAVKVYSFPAPAPAAAHLRVYGTKANGDAFAFVMGQDYTVTLSSDSQGHTTSVSVRLATALPIGWRLTIRRDLPLVQQTRLNGQGPYDPAVVEGALDYSRMIDQQLQAQLDRALLVPEGEDAEAAREALLRTGERLGAVESALANKADKGHKHAQAEVTGLPEKLANLDAAVAGKADTNHTHTLAAVNGLLAALNVKADVSALAGYATATALANGLAGKANAGHGHAVADVAGLQAALDGKAAAVHAHTVANVTGLQGVLDAKAAATHNHTIANVTGLQAILDAKASLAVATPAAAGLMSAADKTKLDSVQPECGGLPAGGNVNDLILNTAPGTGAWTSPAEAAKRLPYASATQPGVVKIGSGLVMTAGVLSATGGGEPGTGTSDHAALANRDASDQHPMSAITGLAEELSAIDADLDGLDAAVTAATTALAGKANTGHGHAVADVAGLQAALDAKVGSSHTHIIRDVVGLQPALDNAGGGPHTHVVADVTGLQAELDAKASLDSPALTGTPTAPTPATSDNSTKVATTTFVKRQNYAPLASPVFTGAPAGPTAPADTNSTWLATTAFVKNAVSGAPGLAPGMLGLFMQRKAELPAGWYYPSGDYVAQSSARGQALLALPANLKSDWGITVSGANIRLCNPDKFFAVSSFGRFLRPINGVDRLPGSLETDAMRDLPGSLLMHSYACGGGSGIFYPGTPAAAYPPVTTGSITGYASVTLRLTDNIGATQLAEEIRPYNVGVTPAIYLGV